MVRAESNICTANSCESTFYVQPMAVYCKSQICARHFQQLDVILYLAHTHRSFSTICSSFLLKTRDNGTEEICEDSCLVKAGRSFARRNKLHLLVDSPGRHFARLCVRHCTQEYHGLNMNFDQVCLSTRASVKAHTDFNKHIDADVVWTQRSYLCYKSALLPSSGIAFISVLMQRYSAKTHIIVAEHILSNHQPGLDGNRPLQHQHAKRW